MKHCIVLDNFIEDFDLERTVALTAKYEDTEHNGLVYPGIALNPAPHSEEKIREALGVQGGTFTTFFRRYVQTEKPVTFIHNDCQIGYFSGVIFLNTPAESRGGLAFWKHRTYGWIGQPPSAQDLEPFGIADTPEFWSRIHEEGFQENLWEMVEYIPMVSNRLVLFRSERYHSRYPKDRLPREVPRLIQTFFWKPDAVQS